MLHRHRTTTPATTATTAVPTLLPCPWCGTYCTGAIRAAHVELDRQSETTWRRAADRMVADSDHAVWGDR
jgi:hypothetical protein